ncbi:AbrB/MazE/SpoVT family DNA-binding domain-containing protein [Elstera sp.]|jgi:hypothetical protein|uniref:AbrB/MazE/SpoVT family DNA-binding domain-containing protein n=1 Tax=Elstera sp. TaxID=1916664 RepID=UPI0037BFC12C
MSKPEIGTLSAKFQLTLPQALCAARQWQPGQEFTLVPKANGLLLVPVPVHDRNLPEQDKD